MSKVEKKHVVIIGGGFGGTYSAKYLKPLIDSEKIDVTIINRTNYFLFTPLLHEVATGGLAGESVVEPIREIFKKSNVHFIQDEVISIDALSGQVTTKKNTIPYDFLVVSSGAETNYYRTPGAKENTFSLKDLGDARAIRKGIIEACEKASLTTNEEERRKLLSFVIVGAGPTGVELAAETIEFVEQILCVYYKMGEVGKKYINVSLVAASPDVLAQFPIPLRKIAADELSKKGIKLIMNAMVMSVEKGKIIFKDNTFVEGQMIVWVAGVMPSVIEIAGAEKEKNGRLSIDEFLRVKGFLNIFSVGDVSGNLPMLAQVATQQGRATALNITASIQNEPLVAFKYFEKGMLVSLGRWYAAGKIFGLILTGPLMWLLWRGIYLFNFHSWKKRFIIAGEWLIGFFYPRDITKE